MADGWEVLDTHELETMEGSGNCTWRLARKGLGIGSFGMNVVEIGPGGSIPEHDEAGRDHEEVFVVLEGDAVAEFDGMERGAPEGSFIRVSPAVRRRIRNDGDAVAKLLIVSAPVSSGYEPMGWG